MKDIKQSVYESERPKPYATDQRKFLNMSATSKICRDTCISSQRSSVRSHQCVHTHQTHFPGSDTRHHLATTIGLSLGLIQLMSTDADAVTRAHPFQPHLTGPSFMSNTFLSTCS